MKSIYIRRIVESFFLLSAISLSSEGQNFDPFAQDTTRMATENTSVRVRSSERERTSSAKDLEKRVVRSQNQVEEALSRTATPWKRIVYRELSLDSVANAPLYYPVRPTYDNKRNLFSLLFSHINKGRIDAYEYEDLGVENYDPSHRIRFEEFLDRFGIMYTKQKSSSRTEEIVVLDADVPSESVKSYYIKEVHYFNPITSTVEVAIESLCPILTEDLDMEGVVKIPLFWVKFEGIKPYISENYIALSDYNNAEIGTLEDFFRLSMYQGNIVRIENLRGRSIEQGNATAEQVAQERERIEKELSQFREKVYGTPYVKETENKTTSKSQEEVAPKKEKTTTTESTARARRAKTIQPAKTKKAPSRSVRNRF